MIPKIIIEKTANYLNIPANSITFNEEQFASDVNHKKIGQFNAILNLMCNKAKLEGPEKFNTELEVELYQWLEYAIMYVIPGSKDRSMSFNLLKTLDTHLMNQSYLCGQFLTLADVLNFYAIFDVIKSLNPSEKERFINLSRWFDHLQQKENINQQNNLVNFTVLHLTGENQKIH
ncbi:eukaryotic translation elongation factor 1 epsilon-1 [Condylostylus longicornis]|uniref:eukaryotic translation elongation factor 1 epsilon-1 n=1 Tax=Condylostylus longicornis TaxID=2530218 RepID=UPI00244E0C64|nr:eukaryotic translation elongation factor 1 epsilon-1 [Condylostylus longicornis]XP_055373855.1 eukaryotic translation elongation factor 1 epsilon-1 [Condylostylus longicornis]